MRTCTNPKCTCDPCTCGDCRCGTARLGDLERKVMEALWAEPGRALKVRAVADRLPEYAYTTVATVLDRLSRKGQVHRTMENRVHLYSAIGTAADHAASAMREALEAAADPAEALSQFVAGIPSGQLETLRQALTVRS